MRKVRVSAVAVVTALAAGLVTGCGGGTEVTASGGGERPTTTAGPTTTAETTTTAAPTTTTEPVDYGAQYMRLVSPANCALAQMEDASSVLDGVEYIDDATWARVQQELLPAIRAYSDATIAFYEGLAAAEWPENVQGDIDTLVAQLATEARQARSTADATTIDAFVATAEQFLTEDDNAAGVVRAKLGLESNVADETEYCTPTT